MMGRERKKKEKRKKIADDDEPSPPPSLHFFLSPHRNTPGTRDPWLRPPLAKRAPS